MANHALLTSTRRGFVTLVGATAFAGCSGSPTELLEGKPTQIDGAELRALTGQNIPSIPERIVVTIDQGHLESNRDRVRELLATVPAPFGSDEIPNGAIREKLTEMHERVRASLNAATTASSPLETMNSLQHARSEAGALHTAWNAIDAGLTRETLLEEAAAVRKDIREFDNRWRYVGDDVVRTVLVTDRIEQQIDWAIRSTTFDTEELKREQENPITVGELGGDLERARVFLDDFRHLYTQYTESLTNPTDLAEPITTAADSLIATIESRQESLPDYNPVDPSAVFDQDISDTPAASALTDLYDVASELGELENSRSNDSPAHVVLLAQEKIAQLGAFTLLYEQIDEGERFVIKSASDVETFRSEALQSINTARLETTDSRLTHRVLTELVDAIRHADRELADVRDTIESRWLARDVAIYVTTMAIARNLPAATAQVVSILERHA